MIIYIAKMGLENFRLKIFIGQLLYRKSKYNLQFERSIKNC